MTKDNFFDFSFVIPNKLAGMARPVGPNGDLAEALEFLKSKGVTVLVSLSEKPLDKKALDATGIRYLHLPVRDFRPPTLEQVEQFVDLFWEEAGAGGALGVHCAGGKGRTGTMLACALVSSGLSAGDAIRRIRELRPGSIESVEQENAVFNYSRELGRQSGED